MRKSTEEYQYPYQYWKKKCKVCWIVCANFIHTYQVLRGHIYLFLSNFLFVQSNGWDNKLIVSIRFLDRHDHKESLFQPDLKHASLTNLLFQALGVILVTFWSLIGRTPMISLWLRQVLECHLLLDLKPSRYSHSTSVISVIYASNNHLNFPQKSWILPAQTDQKRMSHCNVPPQMLHICVYQDIWCQRRWLINHWNVEEKEKSVATVVK